LIAPTIGKIDLLPGIDEVVEAEKPAPIAYQVTIWGMTDFGKPYSSQIRKEDMDNVKGYFAEATGRSI